MISIESEKWRAVISLLLRTKKLMVLLVLVVWTITAISWTVRWLGGHWIEQRAQAKLEERLGVKLIIGSMGFRWGLVELHHVGVRDVGPLWFDLPRAQVHFSMVPLLWGRVDVSRVVFDHPQVDWNNLRPGVDPIKQFLERRKSSTRGEGRSRRLHVEKVVIDHGTVALRRGAAQVRIADMMAVLHPSGPAECRMAQISLETPWRMHVDLGRLSVSTTLKDGKPIGLPRLEFEHGALSLLQGFALSEVSGSLRPDEKNDRRLQMAAQGSYGGATTPLWSANGWYGLSEEEGALSFAAKKFRLSQLDSVLKGNVVDAHEAEFDGGFDLQYKKGALDYRGTFRLTGLNIAHRLLGPHPVHDISFEARASGQFLRAENRLTLQEAVIDFHRVHASLRAEVERVGRSPKFSAQLSITPVPCQLALDAIPRELIPRLIGFQLAGTFYTDLHFGWDTADLTAPVDLGGHVGVEGCKITGAPAATAGKLNEAFVQTVEMEPGHWRSFVVGPQNSDFVPYAEISPYLINSIMTTEDSGFFRHHGFIPSEFRSALQQNLQRGYFRLGASSITMQTVKNVLLSREKTLSRKLQEMFLTWYLEHHLSKERILEIYFNAIEFGPGIYGIGHAARHYFGKTAQDLLPAEAAWFSSILPNPKRRYVQYCHATGTVDAKWDNYLKRILRRTYERGRITQAEYEAAIAKPLEFDRTEAMPEKECLALVARFSPKPVTAEKKVSLP